MLPTRPELHTAIIKLIALKGSDYVGWRQRLRHAVTRRRWSEHGFVPNAEEFQPFLALYVALETKHGSVIAEQRFNKVLQGVTAERKRRYMQAYCARPRSQEERADIRLRNTLYMREYRKQLRMS